MSAATVEREPRSSGCAARTTRRDWPNPPARSRSCSTARRGREGEAGRCHPSSSSTRPTPSSRQTLLGLRDAYPNLIIIRTASKAYALAGLRVGFAVARPDVIARLEPVPSARLRLDGMRHAGHGGAPGRLDASQPRPGRRRTERLAALSAVSAGRSAHPLRISCSSTSRPRNVPRRPRDSDNGCVALRQLLCFGEENEYSGTRAVKCISSLHIHT